METNNALMPSVSPTIVSNIEVNASDVANVGIAVQEERLKDAIKADVEAYSKVTTEGGKLSDKRAKLVQNAVAELSQRDNSKLFDCLKALGFEKPEVKAILLGEERGKLLYAYTVTVAADAAKSKYAGTQSIIGVRSLKLSKSKDILSLEADIDANTKTKIEIQRRLADTRNKLADMSSYERKVKARISMSVLQQSEAGRSMLDIIKTSDTSKLLSA